MPVTFPVQSSTSTAQTVPTVTVWDYILAAGVAQANVTVRCILDGNAQTTISPATLIEPLEQYATTDANGYFSFGLVPTDNMSPANCTYTIITPFRTYQITVPSGGPWQSTGFGIIVNTPVALAPAVTGLTGPLTISSGGLTVSAGGASIAGGLTLTSGVFSIPAGGFSMLGPLTLTAAHSQIIPGATDFSVRDTGNGNDNLLVSNAGVVTARAGLVATAGGLTVSAGGAAITGNAVVTGTLTSTSTLTVSAGGLVVTGNSTVTGTLGVTSLLTAQAALTVSAGDLTVTAGRLVMGAASSKIVPGATGLLLRNNADTQSNGVMTDAGLFTLRNALSIPPSAAGTVAPTAYGSVAVKINELAGDGTTNAITFTSIPTGFRTLIVDLFGRATNAVTNNNLQVQLNADATGVYEWERGNLNGAAGTWASSQGNADSSMTLGYVAGTTAPANAFAHTRITITFANSATLDKILTAEGTLPNAYSAGNINVVKASGVWHNAVPAAVTSIKLLTSAGFHATTALAILRGEP